MVDNSIASLKLIRKNVEMIGAESETKIIKSDSLSFLREAEENSWDLIFADPPYKYDKTSELIEYAKSAVKVEGRFILETSTYTAKTLEIEPIRTKKFGGSVILLFGGES